MFSHVLKECLKRKCALTEKKSYLARSTRSIESFQAYQSSLVSLVAVLFVPRSRLYLPQKTTKKNFPGKIEPAVESERSKNIGNVSTSSTVNVSKRSGEKEREYRKNEEARKTGMTTKKRKVSMKERERRCVIGKKKKKERRRIAISWERGGRRDWRLSFALEIRWVDENWRSRPVWQTARFT